MYSFLKNNLILIFAIIFSLLITSCDDDSITEPKDHFVPIGAVIYDGTAAEVLRIERGVTNDTLTAQVGILSDHYDVKFINDENEIVDPPSDEGLTMRVEVTDPSLLEIEQDKTGAFEFHLLGKAMGITRIELMIIHGDHPDFRTGLIPIKIVN